MRRVESREPFRLELSVMHEYGELASFDAELKWIPGNEAEALEVLDEVYEKFRERVLRRMTT